MLIRRIHLSLLIVGLGCHAKSTDVDRMHSDHMRVDRVDTTAAMLVTFGHLGDTVIVESAPRSSAVPTVWQLDAIPAVEIGGGDSVHALFRDLHSVYVRRRHDGGFVVANSFDSTPPRIFDAQGKFVRYVGRIGRGPGELSGRMSHISLISNDSIVINEERGGTIVFDSAGKYAHAYEARPLPFRFRSAQSLGWFSDGALLIEDQTKKYDGSKGPWALDMYRVPPDRMTAEKFPTMIGDSVIDPPRHTRPTWTGLRKIFVDRGRFFYNPGLNYGIRVYSMHGRLERAIRPSLPPRRIAVEELRQYRTEQAEMERRWRAARPDDYARFHNGFWGVWRWVIDRAVPITVPDTMEAYDAILEDPDGNIWAREWHLVEDVPHRWHVFDSTGVWIGDMHQPDGGWVNEVGRDFMTIVKSDDMGGVHVYLYRLGKVSSLPKGAR